MPNYYAVRSGRNVGVYHTWDDCKEEVTGYSGSSYKKFHSQEEAEAFIKQGTQSSKDTCESTQAQAITRITPDFHQLRQVQPSNRITPTIHRPENIKRQRDPETPVYAKRTKVDFPSTQFPRKMKSVVYTDGASSGNGRKGARAGYGVYWGDNDTRNTSQRLSGPKQTNQRAEATAVIHALEQSLKEPGMLEIRTDSQYVIKAATVWSKTWKSNGWRSSNGKPVENRDLFEKMVNLIDSRKGPVEFTHVAGHSGEPGNEKADQLAVKGAQL